VRIVIDMNLSPLWKATFEQSGTVAVHWSEIGDPRAKDSEIMAWARGHGFIVFTHDLDFGHLLALTHAAGPSVLQLRTQDVLPDRLGPMVLRALDQYREALENGALIVVEPSDFRARILPL